MRPGQVGKVVWHSLRRDGSINFYDVQFGNKLLKNIPARDVISIREAVHEHEEKSERK